AVRPADGDEGRSDLLADGAGAGSFVLDCPRSLAGEELTVDGLGSIISEAAVYVSLPGGTVQSHVLTPDEPTWRIPGAPRHLPLFVRYVRMGLLHILSGFDHLLFLLLLVLTLRRRRLVLAAGTAFRGAHGVSFRATALGWIAVSSSAAEAAIALSIILVALDAGGSAEHPPSLTHTIALAFLFGLVHGLGFAGGLREIG